MGQTVLDRTVPTVADLPDQLRLVAACGPLELHLPPAMAIQLAHALDAGAKLKREAADRKIQHEAVIAAAQEALAKAAEITKRSRDAAIKLVLSGWISGISATILILDLCGVLSW